MGDPDRIPLIDGVLNLADGTIERDAVRRLSDRDRQLLGVLVAAEGRTVDRQALATASGQTNPRTVDFAVRRLRAKLEADPASPRHLLTVHGEGYAFVPEREGRPTVPPPGRRLTIPEGHVDLDAGWVRRGPVEDRLGTRELEVLRHILDAAPEPVPREVLARSVWGRRATSAVPYVDQVLHRLRAKLEPDPSSPTLLVTVPRVGIALRPPLPEVARESRAFAALPPEPDGFVGRRAELEELRGLLDGDARLLTLLGPGGVGKTRLALHLAGQRPGTGFADLSEATTRNGVLVAVGRALGTPLGASPVEQIGHALAGKGAGPLVLDNAEHVMDAVAELVEAWRGRAPELRLIVTSRARLRLRGEHLVEIGPMEPDDASALFVLRAREIRSTFRVGEADADVIAELVELLDRLPLALELAAGRTRVWGLRELRDRLSRRFTVLTGGGRRPTRHQTLRACLDWGWELLTPANRSALTALAAFEGGFDVDAAEAVLSRPGSLDLLQDLVDASWVQSTDADGLRLMQTVRSFLDVVGDPAVRAAAEVRHGRWFATLGAPDALAALHGSSGARALERLDNALSNLVAAADRATDRGDDAVVAPCASAVQAVLMSQGPLSLAIECLERWTGRDWPRAVQRDLQVQLGAVYHRVGDAERAREVLAKAEADAPDAPRARIDGLRAEVARRAGDLDEAEDLASRALAAARATASASDEGTARVTLATVAAQRGEMDTARTGFREALACYRRAGSRSGEASVLNNLGLASVFSGEPDAGRTSFRLALDACHDIGNQTLEAAVWANLGLLEKQLNQRQASEEAWFRSLVLARRVGDRPTEANVLNNLGESASSAGRLDDAARWLRQSETILREIGDPSGLCINLGAQGRLAELGGDLPEAERCYRAALSAIADQPERRAEGTTRASLSSLLMRRGRGEEADTEFARACAQLAAYPIPLLVARVWRADALAAVHRDVEARTLLAAIEAEGSVPGTQAEPMFDDLRRRLGLPDEGDTKASSS